MNKEPCFKLQPVNKELGCFKQASERSGYPQTISERADIQIASKPLGYMQLFNEEPNYLQPVSEVPGYLQPVSEERDSKGSKPLARNDAHVNHPATANQNSAVRSHQPIRSAEACTSRPKASANHDSELYDQIDEYDYIDDNQVTQPHENNQQNAEYDYIDDNKTAQPHDNNQQIVEYDFIDDNQAAQPHENNQPTVQSPTSAPGDLASSTLGTKKSLIQVVVGVATVFCLAVVAIAMPFRSTEYKTAKVPDVTTAVVTAVNTTHAPQLPLENTQLHVTSAKQLIRNITIQTTNRSNTPSSLSLSNDGKSLVVTYHDDNMLYIYTVTGQHLRNLSAGATVWRAAYARSDNVIFAATDPVLANTPDDFVIGALPVDGTYTYVGKIFEGFYCQHIEPSPDSLALHMSYTQVNPYRMTHIARSTNLGSKWITVVNSPPGIQWNYFTCTSTFQHQNKSYVIELWVTEVQHVNRNQLCHFKVHLFGYSRINTTKLDSNFVSVSQCLKSRFVFDGHASVLMLDVERLAVHVWSVSSRQYDRLLLSKHLFGVNFVPTCLAVHSRIRGEEKLLLIHDTTVKVFQLTYEPY